MTGEKAIQGTINRLETYPNNNLPIGQLRKTINKTNMAWSNDTVSWPGE